MAKYQLHLIIIAGNLLLLPTSLFRQLADAAKKGSDLNADEGQHTQMETKNSGGKMASLLDDGPIDHSSSAMRRLQEMLYTNYPLDRSPTVRPSSNGASPVEVYIHLILFNLISLDERSKTMSTNVELMLEWNDSLLKWNPDDFGGINQTHLNPSTIWIPDVILYNSVSEDYDAALTKTNAIVLKTGQVKLLINAVLLSSCSTMNVEYFPFDEQICPLDFVSWTMDQTDLRLSPKYETGDVSEYKPVGEYGLISVDANKSNTTDPCCEPYFDRVTYFIRIRRRPTFFLVTYLLPSVLINALGAATFLVPCESGEKVTLGISAMLSMVVFLMTLAGELPPAVTTPLLSIYYCSCTTLLTVDVLLGVLVLNIFHRGQYGRKPSDLTIAVALIMAKLTFTSLHDPTGYFLERQQAIQMRLKEICKKKDPADRKTSTNQIKAILKVDPVAADNSRAKNATFRPHRRSVLRRMVPDGAAGVHAGNEDINDFSNHFGKSKGNSSMQPEKSHDVLGSPPTHDPSVETNNLLKELLKKVEIGLRMSNASLLRYAEDDAKSNLTMEFMKLARVYDWFFLIMSYLSITLVSLGTLTYSPYTGADAGK